MDPHPGDAGLFGGGQDAGAQARFEHGGPVEARQPFGRGDFGDSAHGQDPFAVFQGEDLVAGGQVQEHRPAARGPDGLARGEGDDRLVDRRDRVLGELLEPAVLELRKAPRRQRRRRVVDGRDADGNRLRVPRRIEEGGGRRRDAPPPASARLHRRHDRGFGRDGLEDLARDRIEDGQAFRSDGGEGLAPERVGRRGPFQERAREGGRAGRCRARGAEGGGPAGAQAAVEDGGGYAPGLLSGARPAALLAEDLSHLLRLLLQAVEALQRRRRLGLRLRTGLRRSGGRPGFGRRGRGGGRGEGEGRLRDGGRGRCPGRGRLRGGGRQHAGSRRGEQRGVQGRGGNGQRRVGSGGASRGS